jgi:hypothetical protein
LLSERFENIDEAERLFAKLLEKRFDRQPCCAGILYECMRFLIGHCKVSAAEKLLSFGCVRTEHRLVSAYINRIINVAWCFGHGILLDPEASILCPFQPVLQGDTCEITLRRGRSWLGVKKRAQYLWADLPYWSTHGPKQRLQDVRYSAAVGGKQTSGE